MHLRLRPFLSLLLSASFVTSAPPAWGGVVELVSTDAAGVTLRVDVPEYEVLEPNHDGRTPIYIPGFGTTAAAGRPQVPYARTLIAVPPGARAVARVVETARVEARDDVVVPIGGASSIQQDAEGLGYVPVEDEVAPILDGSWPASMVEVGERFVVRRQHLVPVAIQPFRYDEATRTLQVTRSVTVRIDFVGGRQARATAAPQDRHWDAVLQGAVLNFEQGRSLRGARTGARWVGDPETRGRPVGPDDGDASLFDRALPGESLLSRVGTAPGARSATAGPLGAAGFDEDAPEVRIKIDSTGVYAFHFTDLEAKGFPSGVPIDEVTVHRHEFDPGAVAPAPPYMTIELPIEVYDANSDGTFNAGDIIVAFVQSWLERANPSIAQRAWGDLEVVYATRLTGGAGLRVSTRPANRGQVGLIPETSYPFTQGRERNAQYMTAYALPRDTADVDPFHWTNFVTYYQRPDTILFDTANLDTTHVASFTSSWVGRTSGNHYMFTRVTNGSGRVSMLSDSSTTVWNGRRPFTWTQPVPGGALSEGLTNRFGYWGKPLPFAPAPSTNEVDFVGLNWIEWTYWRSYRAIRGYLSANSGDGQGEIEVLARGFSDSTLLRAYDVTDPLNPVRLAQPSVEPDGAGWQLRFQDSVAVANPHRYIVMDTPRPVPASRFEAVTRRRLTDRASGDYLLITPEAFMGASQALANYRAGQGLSVVMAPLEAVNDEFNGGRHSAYSIRRFIRFAYENWDVRFVLFMGDGSEDPQNHTGVARPDWVPTQLIGGPVQFSTGSGSAFERIPSDNWYGWCITCDSFFGDQVPEVFIGRFPVNSASQVTDVVNKVIAYENFSGDQSWRRKMLIQADDEYSGLTTFGGPGGGVSTYCRKFYEDRFRLLSETLRNVVLVEAGLIQSEPEVFDLGFYLANEPEDENMCRPDLQATRMRTRTNVTPLMFSRLNEGRLWWNYQGHANEFEMGHEDVYLNLTSDDDLSKFVNDGKLFLFSGFACHPNSFGRANEAGPRGAAFGEELVTLRNRGAIASWATTGYEVIPHNGTDHVNVEFGRALFVDPPRDPFLGELGARPVIGEVIGQALLRWVQISRPYGNEQKVGMSYVLLGDPATRMWAGPAQGALTANAVPVTSGTPIRLQTPGDTLQLRAQLVSNSSLASIMVVRSDSASVDTLPLSAYTISPAFPDTGSASHGGRSYLVSVDTTGVPRDFTYSFRTVDRYGVAAQHDAVFTFTTILRAGGQLVTDGDPVAPTADLSLQVLSPAPIVPAADLTLLLNGQPIAFTAVPDGGDPSGRQWTLTWTHPPYPIDDYVLQLDVAGGARRIHLFNVQVGGSELRVDNLFTFPNPFQEDIGTRFSFTLVSGGPTDVALRVYTVAGKIVHQSVSRSLPPGYNQIPWDGRDPEGTHVANGTYFYRLVADNGQSKATYEGRIVKLRRPRRQAIDETTP